MTTITSTMVSFETPDGTADAYLARPDDGQAHPGVLFYSDIFALRPTSKQMVDEYAAAGYTVLAPNLWYRSGPTPVVDLPEYVANPDELWASAMLVFPFSREQTVEQQMIDAEAYLDWLDASEWTVDAPHGMVGYCHGGMLALRTAVGFPDRVAAASIIHGSAMLTDEPNSAHIGVEKITAELFFGNGGADDFNTPEQSAKLDEILTEAGVNFHSELWPGLQHGWTARDSFVYDKEGDELHYDRTLKLFDRVLK